MYIYEFVFHIFRLFGNDHIENYIALNKCSFQRLSIDLWEWLLDVACILKSFIEKLSVQKLPLDL